MGDRNLSVVYVFGPRLQGFFRFSIDLQAGFLVVNSTADEDGTRSVRIGEDMSTPSCIRYVREALGDPEIPVEIENVQRWSASAEYAERLQAGRIFLAGDSAHVMPPTGGFGGNCGVQDGYDLAWKLAYVLDGRADETLLATYDAERQPVGAFTTEQAYTRYVLRLDPSLGKEDLMPIVGEAPIDSVTVISPLPSWPAPTTTVRCGRTRASRLVARAFAPRTCRSPSTASNDRRWISSGAALSCSAALAARAGLQRHVRRAPRSACPWTCTGSARTWATRAACSRALTAPAPRAPFLSGRTGLSPGGPRRRAPIRRATSRARWARRSAAGPLSRPAADARGRHASAPGTQNRSPRSASSLASCSRWISRTRAGVIASSGSTSSISRLVLSSYRFSPIRRAWLSYGQMNAWRLDAWYRASGSSTS